MRIRSIKPEFWRSVDITSLAIEDRLLFIGLWSYVDDNGVGVDQEHTIIGDLFAADMFRLSRETVARVSGGLSNLAEAGLIIRYTVDRRPFLFITNWEAHQRIDKPGKARYPRSDAQNAILATSSRHSRDILAPGTGEQGSSGTGNRGADSSSEIANATVRVDVESLLDILDHELERNGVKKPSRNKKNWDAARLLMDKDGRTFDQVSAAIRWATSDEFWRSNILSMSALRDKYDRLRLDAERKRGEKPTSKADKNAAEFHRLYGGQPEIEVAR